MDDAGVTRCARCDMRAPDGKKHCAACARALREDGGASGPAASGSPWGVRQYVAIALLGGLVVTLGAAALANAIKPTPARNAYIERADPLPTGTPAPPAKPSVDPAQAIRVTYQAQYAAAKSEDRENAVRTCLLTSTCPQAQLDGIIAAGAHEREREVLRRRSHAWGAHVAAKGGTDGTELDSVAVAAAAAHMTQCGISDLKKLDWTTQGEADKDIAGARGKMINAYGYVHQIRKEGDLHWGTMTTSAGWVYFVVVGQTKGVVSGRYAEVAGMVVQRYHYENAAGGRTDSILVVGRVRNQADCDPPLPTAPVAAVQSPRGKPSSNAAPAPSAARPSSTWGLPFPSPEAAGAAKPAGPQPPLGRSPAVLDEAPPPPAQSPAQAVPAPIATAAEN